MGSSKAHLLPVLCSALQGLWRAMQLAVQWTEAHVRWSAAGLTLAPRAWWEVPWLLNVCGDLRTCALMRPWPVWAHRRACRVENARLKVGMVEKDKELNETVEGLQVRAGASARQSARPAGRVSAYGVAEAGPNLQVCPKG